MDRTRNRFWSLLAAAAMFAAMAVVSFIGHMTVLGTGALVLAAIFSILLARHVFSSPRR